MRNGSSTLLLASLLVGCSSDPSSGGGDDQPDAALMVPAMVTISGSAIKHQGTNTAPADGVLVEAYLGSDENAPMATTMTDATGNYTITLATNGVAMNAYIKATLTGFVTTYLYPAHPLTSDFSGSLNMLDDATVTLLSSTFCGSEQDMTKGLIAVRVADATDKPVEGATIASDPAAAKYCYNANGYPNRNQMATDVDGIAYMLNVPAGTDKVSATKSGTTFFAHTVTARPGTITTTVIAP